MKIFLMDRVGCGMYVTEWVGFLPWFRARVRTAAGNFDDGF